MPKLLDKVDEKEWDALWEKKMAEHQAYMFNLTLELLKKRKESIDAETT